MGDNEMKYLLALLIAITPLTVFAGFPKQKISLQTPKTEYILLETTDGEFVRWPKNVFPMISIVGVSTKNESHMTYRFIVRDKNHKYVLPITEASYHKYKREMGLK
jgi:hypothetical protein